MSRATVKAHRRGLKNTLLWKNHTPVTAEDCHGYGQHLEDLCQEKEAVIWYEKAVKQGYIPAMFQLAKLMKNRWQSGDFYELFRQVMDHDLHNIDVISCYRLGRCFTQGWGTDVDEHSGWNWFQKALADCEALDDVYPHLLYELSFYHREGLAGIEIDTALAWKYLKMAHESGCQKAVWELWRQFPGNFSDFPLRRDYTEAWSFQLGRYVRAAEAAPCTAYFLRLSRFYAQVFPDDSEENRLKMQQFANEYAHRGKQMEKTGLF